MSRLEIQVPLRRAMSRLFCEVFSLVRTKKLPIIEAKMPMAASTRGSAMPAAPSPALTASVQLEMIAPT